MPNWCLHKLTITGPEADAQAPKEFGAKHKPCKWTKPSLLLKTTAKCGSYSVPFSAASATKLEPLPTGLRRSVSPGLPRRIWLCLMWTCPMVRASISVVPSRAGQTWPPSPYQWRVFLAPHAALGPASRARHPAPATIVSGGFSATATPSAESRTSGYKLTTTFGSSPPPAGGPTGSLPTAKPAPTTRRATAHQSKPLPPRPASVPA